MTEVELFLKALIATVVIEETITLVFVSLSSLLFHKQISFRLFYVVLWANILTNPTINFIWWNFPLYLTEQPVLCALSLIALEIIVFVVEMIIFFRFGDVQPLKIAIVLSLLLNLSSYFSGAFLQRIGYWEWSFIG